MDGLVNESRIRPRALIVLACALLVSVGLASCAKREPPVVRTFSWALGGSEPEFDPLGPPDSRRWALERLMTRGLVDEDSAGAIVPAAAESVSASADSLVWTFHLRPDLTFTDGSPCRAQDFTRTMLDGLSRNDHSTYRWAFAAVSGVDAIRPRKPLPPVGIETPDDRTVVVRLARADVLFLQKLAVPGMSGAWKPGASTWGDARGIGPYRPVAHETERRLRFVPAGSRFDARPPADTIMVRFGLVAGRVRTLLRNRALDLAWPLPFGMLDESIPANYRVTTHRATPRRQVLLAMRVDLPPTSRIATRNALAHGINREEVIRQLGPGAERRTSWITGAPPAEFPALDGAAIETWMERGKLGISFHVDMAYRGDGPGAAIARSLQGEWAGHGIYVEPRPLRGARYFEEALSGLMHLVLVESQGLIADPSGELAQFVMPLRGPAVGSFRTGWRTREFDAWIGPRATHLDVPVDVIERRMGDEGVVLPLAEIPWAWVERSDAPELPWHPHFGPEVEGRLPPKIPPR